MHPLDIISNSPNLYILQKGSNKTNFGGFLFLLYLLVTLLIFIIYIIDYVQNDKYIIQSFSHFNLKTDEEIQLRNTDELYNQNINFKLDLRVFVQGKELYLDEKFKLYDNNAGQFIERNKHFNKKITEFEIYVLYECDNFTCSEYDDFLKYVEEIDIGYYLPGSFSKDYDAHPLREPMPRRGILIMIDGTPHDWFNNGIKF
jgi:hypothetical protein